MSKLRNFNTLATALCDIYGPGIIPAHSSYDAAINALFEHAREDGPFDQFPPLYVTGVDVTAPLSEKAENIPNYIWSGNKRFAPELHKALEEVDVDVNGNLCFLAMSGHVSTPSGALYAVFVLDRHEPNTQLLTSITEATRLSRYFGFIMGLHKRSSKLLVGCPVRSFWK